MTSARSMPFGAELQPDGGVRFRLWAPDRAAVALMIQGDGEPVRHEMQPLGGGWHELVVASARAGTRYRYAFDDGLDVPDPASRYNPLDVAGPSEVVDPTAYRWRDAGWRGRPWHEAVIYELHIGCFTPEGTFAAAQARLADLVALGVTAIELMPVAEFPGRRSWGYDGVLLFAPDASYGTPDELKALIDHAHTLGLMVLLDVVYNHFGPEGNYLHAYSERFFNDKHQTPWGAAINFDGEHNATIRDFFVHNALMWIDDYHFDGLRVDAVHAIRDDSERHIIDAIVLALRESPRERPVHVVLENADNDAQRLQHSQGLPARLADGQWNDDFHHAAHVVLTGETDSYYVDFADAPLRRLALALAEGFVYQGEPFSSMEGQPRGQPSRHLPSNAFVAFIQNHDQIGNRPFGDRITGGADVQRLDAMYACLLLAPHIPLLFMGEEWAASTPFTYFCDFGPELTQAVREGRRREFASTKAFAEAHADIPDAGAEATFEACKLNWQERDQGPHAARLALITSLIALRQSALVPLLPSQAEGGHWTVNGSVVAVDWVLGQPAGAARPVTWRLRANFGDAEAVGEAQGDEVYATRASRSASALHLAPAGVWVGVQR